MRVCIYIIYIIIYIRIRGVIRQNCGHEWRGRGDGLWRLEVEGRGYGDLLLWGVVRLTNTVHGKLSDVTARELHLLRVAVRDSCKRIGRGRLEGRGGQRVRSIGGKRRKGFAHIAGRVGVPAGATSRALDTWAILRLIFCCIYTCQIGKERRGNVVKKSVGRRECSRESLRY